HCACRQFEPGSSTLLVTSASTPALPVPAGPAGPSGPRGHSRPIDTATCCKCDNTEGYWGHRIHRMKERKVAGATSHDCASTSLRPPPNQPADPPPHLATHRLLRLLPWRGDSRSRIPPSPGIFSAWRSTAPAISTPPTDNHIIRKVTAAG